MPPSWCQPVHLSSQSQPSTGYVPTSAEAPKTPAPVRVRGTPPAQLHDSFIDNSILALQHRVFYAPGSRSLIAAKEKTGEPPLCSRAQEQPRPHPASQEQPRESFPRRSSRRSHLSSTSAKQFQWQESSLKFFHCKQQTGYAYNPDGDQARCCFAPWPLRRKPSRLHHCKQDS